ncbi:MAG: hypothetical protein V4497_06740 [Bacteroidota bacterium]
MIKNISPVYLYMMSVVCFVVANLVRDKIILLYYILLLFGVVFFVIGFKKRISKK